MDKWCNEVSASALSKCLYFGLVLVLLLLVVMKLRDTKGSLSEALTDWAAGTPNVMETPQGYGYVESPMPYGGLGGPNIRFNVLSATNMQPYSAGYNEKGWSEELDM